MTCEEAQSSFSFYLDGQLPYAGRAATDAHLRQCPLCRMKLDEMRSIIRGLAGLERPVPPSNLAASISDALMIERAARVGQPLLSLHVRIIQWIRPRVMPYTVGALASLLLFVAIMSALRPHMRALRELEYATREELAAPSELAWDSGGGGYDITRPISLQGYAESRIPYAAESPSLNPRGALATLAWTPPSGRVGDDDMVVVTDVFSNGSASLAAVVQPPRNRHILDEFQDALRKNPAFVPASFDGRPQTMRVVFVMQKMNVPERSF